MLPYKKSLNQRMASNRIKQGVFLLLALILTVFVRVTDPTYLSNSDQINYTTLEAYQKIFKSSCEVSGCRNANCKGHIVGLGKSPFCIDRTQVGVTVLKECHCFNIIVEHYVIRNRWKVPFAVHFFTSQLFKKEKQKSLLIFRWATASSEKRKKWIPK